MIELLYLEIAKCTKKCIILPPDSWGGITQEKDLNHR